MKINKSKSLKTHFIIKLGFKKFGPMKLLTSVAIPGILSIVMLCTEARAQFSAGLKAGLNMSTLSVDDGSTKYSYTPGFQVGGFLDYNLVKLSFQLDVLYSTQGADIKSNGKNLSAVAKYVNIPLAVKYNITPAINLHAGPQIGFLTCFHSDYHPITHEPFEEQDYTKAYKKSDFGINVGAGWATSKGLIIDLRYYVGLTDINNYPGIGSTKNRVLQLSVGYKIYKR
jgi:hypothetical protein